MWANFFNQVFKKILYTTERKNAGKKLKLTL